MDTQSGDTADNPAASPAAALGPVESSPTSGARPKLNRIAQLRVLASAMNHFPAIENAVREIYEAIERGSPRAAVFFNNLPVPPLQFPPGMEMLPEHIQIFLTRVLIVQYLWRDLEKFSARAGVPNPPDLHVNDIDVDAIVDAYVFYNPLVRGIDGAEEGR